MELAIKGKGLEISDAFRAHVADSLVGAVEKYFSRAHDATVTVSREGTRFRADLSVHPISGVMLQGRAQAADAYAAFDAALERMAKQLRRYKRRLTNHHPRRPTDEAVTPAQQYIIAPESDEELPEEGQPAIIAELPTEIATLSVGEAVMRMDLADMPALMFRNRANGGLNVIYRRPDGNIGWIDPANSRQS